MRTKRLENRPCLDFLQQELSSHKEEELKIERYEQISSSISSKRAEFQAARQKVRGIRARSARILIITLKYRYATSATS